MRLTLVQNYGENGGRICMNFGIFFENFHYQGVLTLTGADTETEPERMATVQYSKEQYPMSSVSQCRMNTSAQFYTSTFYRSRSFVSVNTP